jgi:phosphoribosyl 1,2-cyclic phosphodiesterase
MKLHILATGVNGTAYLVSSGNTRVLLDCGLPAGMMLERLGIFGIDPQSIDAAVLTHEHGDHACGLADHPFRDDFPVFASAYTCEVGKEMIPGARSLRWCPVEAEESFAIGALGFRGFPVPHDSVDPLGWVVGERKTGFRLGYTGDAGHCTTWMTETLAAADRVLIHAHHDEDLLHAAADLSAGTRQRFLNRHGHLSNDQARDLVARLAARGRLDGVLLGHLHPRWNSPARALAEIESGLAAVARQEIPVHCLRPGQLHDWEGGRPNTRMA